MEIDGEVSSVEPRKPNRNLENLLVFKVYKRRWFVLLLLCLLNCSNATIWISFAPVADESAKFLKTTLYQINWLSMVYMVVAIPLSFGTTWMLDVLGLRITLILGSWLNMIGALLRLFGVLPIMSEKQSVGPYGYPVTMLGQTFGAVAQPLMIFTPTKLAALWFPDNQRAIANMIASMSNPLGILLANIISPKLVTTYTEIPYMVLAYAVPACIICFLATVGLWSGTPPTPPSASAQLSTSEPFLQGIKLLLKNKAYIILMLSFGSGIAAFTCFSTLLEQILCVHGYSNDFAGLCGALFIIFGILGAALLGVYVDKTKKFIEVTKINLGLCALMCIAFSVVSLLRQQEVAIAAVCSLFGFFGFSTYAIAMELSVECSYPVGEATSTGLIFVSGQVQSVLYILLLQALTTSLADSPLSTCGGAVLSWKVPMLVMAGLCTVAICCFILFFHTNYKRLEAEQQVSGGRSGGGNSSSTTSPNDGATTNQSQ